MPVKDCFVLKVSRIQNLPRTSATLHLHFHSISRIRKARGKLLPPADLNSLSNSSRAPPTSLIVMCLYKLLCHKYNIYTECRVKKRNEAHRTQMGFVGDVRLPVWQSINRTRKSILKSYHCNHSYFLQQWENWCLKANNSLGFLFLFSWVIKLTQISQCESA